MVQLSPLSVATEPTNAIADQDYPLAIATLDVQGMKCAGCVSAVERQLIQNSGVVSACVNLVTEVAVVKYQQGEIAPETLAEKLSDRGFPAQLRTSSDSQKKRISTNQRRQQSQKEQLWGLSVAALLLIFSGIGHWGHISGKPLPILSNIWFHWGLATLALLIPGRTLIVDGWRSLAHGMPSMNTLVGLGTCSAYLASFAALLFPALGWECFFDEPVMLLGFILLGRTLEAKARNRASAALEALVALQPSIACLLGNPDQLDQSGIEIPVEQVRVGEWLRILPGEKIPVDAKITAGNSTIDESLLTGESIPVLKQKGDNAIAGTVNQSGVLVIEATRIGEDTTLAQIISSVEEAQTRKVPIQQLADTVAGYFAYGVMAIALVTFMFWEFWGTNLFPSVLSASMGHSMTAMTEPMTTTPTLLSLKLAIAVLVIACPCALGLATPTAILVGTGIGAERGLLIKGGDILEKTKQLNTIVFDKTGTLTLGRPSVTDYLLIGDMTEERLLQLAATVENGTNHPLAVAILKTAQDRALDLLEASDFYTQPGLGVIAEISAQKVLLGNETWLTQYQIPLPEKYHGQIEELSQAGKTLVYVAMNDTLVGIIALQDQLRPDAQVTVKKLQDLGLEVILLTGDQPLVANAIAAQVGITEVFSQVQPDQKVAIIQSLQNPSENLKKSVAMVGDGINDAPALAQADVGISLRGATDVARSTADVVLMRSQLLDILAAIELSNATVKKIQENLVWALGYNVIAIPVAAGILLPHWGLMLSPAIAGAFMAVSSIIVVTNSLGLRRQFPVKF
jgi:Cu2+-exporting ATPase